MSWVHQMVGGKWIDPGRLNPCRQRRAARAVRPPTQAENAAAWRVLDTFFVRAGGHGSPAQAESAASAAPALPHTFLSPVDGKPVSQE